jgi:hypothetical protein
MKKCLSLLVLMASSILATNSYGQGSTDYGTGIKLDLNPEKTKYIRLITWNQTWFRATELNPGTTIGGEAKKTNFDISGRRLRIIWYWHTLVSTTKRLLMAVVREVQGQGGTEMVKNLSCFFTIFGMNITWYYPQKKTKTQA